MCVLMSCVFPVQSTHVFSLCESPTMYAFHSSASDHLVFLLHVFGFGACGVSVTVLCRTLIIKECVLLRQASLLVLHCSFHVLVCLMLQYYLFNIHSKQHGYYCQLHCMLSHPVNCACVVLCCFCPWPWRNNVSFTVYFIYG